MRVLLFSVPPTATPAHGLPEYDAKQSYPADPSEMDRRARFVCEKALPPLSLIALAGIGVVLNPVSPWRAGLAGLQPAAWSAAEHVSCSSTSQPFTPTAAVSVTWTGKVTPTVDVSTV